LVSNRLFREKNSQSPTKVSPETAKRDQLFSQNWRKCRLKTIGENHPIQAEVLTKSAKLAQLWKQHCCTSVQCKWFCTFVLGCNRRWKQCDQCNCNLTSVESV